MLREVDGMKVNDVADCLNITVANVKTKTCRAKKLLQEILYDMSITPRVFEFGKDRCDNMVKGVMDIILEK